MKMYDLHKGPGDNIITGPDFQIQLNHLLNPKEIEKPLSLCKNSAQNVGNPKPIHWKNIILWTGAVVGMIYLVSEISKNSDQPSYFYKRRQINRKSTDRDKIS